LQDIGPAVLLVQRCVGASNQRWRARDTPFVGSQLQPRVGLQGATKHPCYQRSSAAYHRRL